MNSTNLLIDIPAVYNQQDDKVTSSEETQVADSKDDPQDRVTFSKVKEPTISLPKSTGHDVPEVEEKLYGQIKRH
jgi:hypothetical protein